MTLSTIGGMPIAEIEQALTAALTRSLCVAPADRPAFIARHLADGEAAATALLPAQPKPPAELDAAVANLAALAKEAVNVAARHGDQPLQRIADYLLRSSGRPGLRLEGDIVVEEEAAPPPAAAEAAGSSPAAAAAAPPTAAAAAAAASTSGGVLAAALQKSSAATAGASASKPTLGSRPSKVLPAVIGAFQEEAAKRIAKHVDEDVIAEAMRAGAAAGGTKTDGSVEALNEER